MDWASRMTSRNSNSDITVGIIGLGYVGLPTAIGFHDAGFTVWGVDVSQQRVDTIRAGRNPTGDPDVDDIVPKPETERWHITTSTADTVPNCDIILVTVPTPITQDLKPDLSYVEAAGREVFESIRPGSGTIVVLESTVYPGVTAQTWLPIIEEIGLKIGTDVEIAYCPERFNPGDKAHGVRSVARVIGCSNPVVGELLVNLYSQLTTEDVRYVGKLEVAEAAKVIENAQRDLNIAFVNELAQIFYKMGIDTNEVLEAASTKWNFLNFKPGLVGGHCIGIDPYYLSYKAKNLGYEPKIILSGRETNELVPKFIFEVINEIIKKKKIEYETVLILGATFKENCPDIRNSKSFDLFKIFNENGFESKMYDPFAGEEDMKSLYSENYINKLETRFDVIVIAVGHSSFSKINLSKISYKHTIIYDVKSIYPKSKGYLRL